MPTLAHTLTATPVDIVAELSLEQDTIYALQPRGTTVLMVESASEPDPAMKHLAHKLAVNEVFQIQPTGTSIWMWADGAEAPIVITEAPA